MVKKTVGFTHLEWTCPNCGSRNPGPQKLCGGCGAAQPVDVKFEQTEGAQLIDDQAEIEKAKAGADIHCAFCEARNPAGSVKCVNCGADLKEGKQRESGAVVGAFKGGAVEQNPCPSCGALNPATNLRCVQCGSPMQKAAQPVSSPPTPAKKMPLLAWLGIGALALVVGVCLLIGLLSLFKRTTLSGTVQSVAWQRSIVIESYGAVEKSGWKKDVPAGAKVISCGYQFSGEQDQPAPVATETCGTPYSVDKGSGYAEVVQDCTYQVYEEACKYTEEGWAQSDTAVREGTDLNPSWPDPQLSNTQRLGEGSEKYQVVFNTSKKEYTYSPTDLTSFQQFQPGSTWTLTVNALGGVVSVSP
jgi:ribosomal protein L40E